MQIREIQLYQFGIIRSSSGNQNIGRDAHVYHIVVYHPVFQKHGLVFGYH